MTTDTPAPADDAGINALRLDADRARDDLEATLDEIEERLNPRRVWQVLRAAFANRPGAFVAVASGVVAATVGAVVWTVTSRGNRG
jgi:hypothetical protein